MRWGEGAGLRAKFRRFGGIARLIPTIPCLLQSRASIGSYEISIETGKLARLADGAVTVRSGDTIVLVTAVSATKVKAGQDFFPLTVDYREKAAAVGKIPGGYFKREGRPSEKEILTARMTDRPLRPLFPKGYFYDTQIISTVLSADGEHDPDILTINGASAALMVSDIPFAGPIGAVRVGRVNGEFVVNPTHCEREESDLNIVYVGSRERHHHDRGRGQRTARRGIHQGARLCPGPRQDARRAAEGTRRQGRQAEALGRPHARPSRNCSRSPTRSPATASRRPFTPRARSPA